jgi:hypothetical protein
MRRIRQEVIELGTLGPFPASGAVELTQIEQRQRLLDAIKSPVTDAEARELVKLFGPDDYFGLAWTVLHLVESAPGWPLEDCLASVDDEWIQTLRRRVENAKRDRPR